MPITRLFGEPKLLDGDTHGTSGTCDDLGCCIQVVCVQVGHLGLCDLAHLSLGQRANLGGVGNSGTLSNASSLLDQLGSRRGLGDEGEGAILVDGNLNGMMLPRCDSVAALLCLAELHDVHTVRAQCGADGGSRVSGACLDLQLNEASDLLLGSQCRVLFLAGNRRTGAYAGRVMTVARPSACAHESVTCAYTNQHFSVNPLLNPVFTGIR